MAAVLCLIATPIYFSLVSRFNANTVLRCCGGDHTVRVAGARSDASPTASHGTAGGGTPCYRSITPRCSCCAVPCVAPPGSGAVWCSRSAVACYLVRGRGLVPHLIWLRAYNHIPFAYFQETTARPFTVSLREAAIFPFTCFGFFLPALLIYASRCGHTRGRGCMACAADGAGMRVGAICCSAPRVDPGDRCGALGHGEADLHHSHVVHGPDLARHDSRHSLLCKGILRVCRGCAHFLLFYLVAAPLVAAVGFDAPSFATHPTPRSPGRRPGVARQVRGPLRIIGGDESYALTATFYSPDHPSYLLGFDLNPFTELGRHRTPSDLALSPWVRAPDLAGRGWRSSARGAAPGTDRMPRSGPNVGV